MNPVPLLDLKRRGEALPDEAIAFLVAGAADGSVPDYQLAAFLMAVCCRGMDARETATLTERMLRSGTTLEWGDGPPVADKHSTGGIGDKSSLILAPLLAAAGLRVPMISGRGLGPTGGTLDKLESIPGFRTGLPLPELRAVVGRIGVAMVGQTADLCPADRKLYALRDATGTVASIPLITASILSKKIAEGLDALVLDVKHGSGAFMKTLPEARELARSMVAVAGRLGVRATALLTDMNQPTGRMVGNALEVQEAVACLRGAGPADLMELVYLLGVEPLIATGLAPDAATARRRLEGLIADGSAHAKWRELVRAHGGDPDAVLPVAPAEDFRAPRGGWFARLDGSAVGYALIALGGGRRQTTDRVDPAVGFEFLVRLGDRVERGQPLLKFYAAAGNPGRAEALALLEAAFGFSDSPVPPPPLLVERIATP